ncbi:TPA: Arc family DNA-binding protein, partial [Pseudomonas aeruginosa]|nr:Arc family DNA-binding protein [Pseudomonas aeruginosa]
MKNVTSIDRKHAEDKFVVRMPQGLRDQLKQKAADNHRSANSEIVYRLERSNALEEELARANRMVDELFAKNQRLQAELAAANTPQ